MVVLWAVPAGAQTLEIHRSFVAPPELPERPAFEELLWSFADPGRGLQGGFAVPSVSLAVRARAWAFVQPGAREQREAWDVLSLSSQDLTLSDIPAGGRLARFLELGPEGERFRVHDLGMWLRGPEGPLRKTLGPMLERLPGKESTAALAASVVGIGLAYQFGTAQAQALGLSPVLKGTTLGGRLHGSVHLQTEPHFKNVRADVAAHFRLPEVLRLPLGGQVEQLEVGGTAARVPEGLLLDARWAHLRGRVSWLELNLGVRSNHAEPRLWMDLETSVRRERFDLRAVFSRQWVTARTLATATATLRTGPVLSGLFLGLQGRVKYTFGLVSMGTF
ncbi:MAG TPA: hypothetical protein VF794_34585 [Archangium sp.]|jgi:hypothetical protein|uniref:hypothetical protein n=1 Tax=Archangium sp. TaxID=1872627 RepID=UPI002ED93E9D